MTSPLSVEASSPASKSLAIGDHGSIAIQAAGIRCADIKARHYCAKRGDCKGVMPIRVFSYPSAGIHWWPFARAASIGAFSIPLALSSDLVRRIPSSAFGRACAARVAADKAQTCTNLLARRCPVACGSADRVPSPIPSRIRRPRRHQRRLVET